MKHVSLAARLAHWAETRPDATALDFLGNGERVTETRTYAELDRRARAFAAHLQQAPRGSRALLLLPSGAAFVEAFFGCLYAGHLAVPLYPAHRQRSFNRLSAVVEDAGATIVVCETAAETTGSHAIDALAHAHWLAADSIDARDAELWRPHEPGADDIAMLQYTSGSTSDPRGVMVTHANLVHNTAMLQLGFGHRDGARVGGWLPLHHDLGLIGLVLQAVHLGGTCVLMSPMDFLRRPVRWVRAIAEHRIEMTGAPNFAYDLVVERTTPETRAALDLSHWRVTINGAEPISLATLDRFAEAFAPSGLRRETLCPGYGLAEATLFVSGNASDRLPVSLRVDPVGLERHVVRPVDQGGRVLAGSGSVRLGIEVAIVDPDTCRVCPQNRVGEIWVRDPGVALGYWNRETESAAIFRAAVADTGESPYLRTGDLGFVHDGELYVTGRIKDLIIIDGRNHYPQDLEGVVRQAHPAVRENVVAFAVDGDAGEALVVVAEIDPRWARRADAGPDGGAHAIRAAIRSCISEAHEVHARDIVLTGIGEILRTTSGKVQRKACRAKYLAGGFGITPR